MKRSTVQFDVFFFHLLNSNHPDNKCHKQVTRVIFYTHQTSGACAGVCACDLTHQMDKIADDNED